ncbi:MAG: hypothetical protein MK132_27810 [Lentisphaerales bacterium]|nr:hypothetical protein [Lentisphaerales bacterium]
MLTKVAIKAGKHWETVAKYYDGSAYFKNVNYPTLWVNGTNDFHFDLPATQKSSNAVSGSVTLRYQLQMGHGHQAVWNTKECYAFADSVIKGKTSLLKVKKPKLQGSTLSVKTIGKISKAKLLYTKGTEKVWPDREWAEIPAALNGQTVAGDIPDGATAVYFNIYDTNNMMVSSEFIEVK